MDLSEKEKSLLRNLYQSPVWETLVKIAQLKTIQIKSVSLLKDTDWQTLRELYLQEGEIKGIKNFLQEIINQLQEKEE